MSEFRIEKLIRQHPVDQFDSGAEPLNRFLKLHALNSQLANAAQTYLALSGETIIGFHSLAVGEVNYSDAPERLAKGLARHPIPVMILARLAVHKEWQGKGIGAGLLKDAVMRTLAAADIAGIRGMVVHAKDDAARAFYERFDFVGGFGDPMHLFALMKDLRAQP